ncbi:MAG: terminase family protein [Pirellulaceae bacterium]|nr:terminase family protein [Pirellulaceae bacterium]
MKLSDTSWIKFATDEQLKALLKLFPKPTNKTNNTPLQIYCPIAPTPKQTLFLKQKKREVFYGGAAGGGKSNALLMGALQYVHIPGYSAIILRKDLPRLRLSGGLLPQSHAWFSHTSATWNSRDWRWTFPTSQGSPATISFGYLKNSLDKFRYGSSEYQYIAFDELTEFTENDYLFMFSRLRSTKKINVPLRIRAASNPGNLGHQWVKRRFIPEFDHLKPKKFYQKNGRVFIPASIADNPFVNEKEYTKSLQNLPTVLRERLLNGDWRIQDIGLIKQEWLQYYSFDGGKFFPLNQTKDTPQTISLKEGTVFTTIDPAGTSAEKARETKGYQPSWSVASTWFWSHNPVYPDRLFLLSVWRERVSFDRLCAAIENIAKKWQPKKILIENEKLGKAAVDILGQHLPIETIATRGQDKVTRAAPFINKLQQGEIYFPEANNGWLATFEAELLGWTGLPQETSDQIDTAAYAADYLLKNRPQQGAIFTDWT